MEKMKRDLHIDAPVEKVFDFISKPEHMPEIWPSMIRVDNVKDAEVKGGLDYDWDYKMAGIEFHGRTHTLEFEPYKHVVIENKEGIPSRFVWDYRAENGGTHLDLEVEYTIPMPVLGKLAEKVVLKINENEIDALLSNLKAAVEP